MPTMRLDESERLPLFTVLLNHFGASPDNRGWVHAQCPSCGKEGSRKDIHFSFSLDHGCKCQSCGWTGNLKQLAALVNVSPEEATRPLPPPPPPPEPKHYAWMDELPGCLETYASHPDLYREWGKYRKLTAAQVDKYHLGMGKFPAYSSQCQHTRLMVPMMQNGKPVAFRGRALGDCDHKKWLSTSMGGRSPLLFNGGVLLAEKDRSMVDQYDLTDSIGLYCRDRILLVVENPIDCLLMQEAGLCAVATLGVTMWTGSRPWTELLGLARPARVVVMYDHDLPGNGARDELEYARMVEAWKKEHGGIEPPKSNGPRLAELLNNAGISATIFHWPTSSPIKADPGWMIEMLGPSVFVAVSS